MPNDQDQELCHQTHSSSEIDDECSSKESSDVGPGHNSGSGSIANCEIKNDLRPELVVENKLISELKPAGRRVRKLNNKQIARQIRSIKTYGFVLPILIDSTGKIIDGHSRVEAAKQMGLKQVPCIRINHLSKEEVRALRIALNKIQETGSWDEGALKLEFEYLLEFGVDLTVTGFEPVEIDTVLEIGGPVEDADPLDEMGEMPGADAEAVTRLGDIWKLEDHRILCGNALFLDICQLS